MFWDKLEKANYFLENIILTFKEPYDGRLMMHLLNNPVQDGGQWDMFVNLIKKHGVVPKTVMPESESSGNSARMNSMINYQIRQGAMNIRELYSQEGEPQEIRELKNGVLNTIYKILCIHLGTPPDNFLWQWKDKDGQFQRAGQLTPQEFAKKYLTTAIEDYVCLVHDPRSSSPIGRTFTIQYLGNVVGGDPVKYLNVDIGLIKQKTMLLLLDGLSVCM